MMFRRRNSTVELLLVHPGGPFWAKKDVGSWSIPKGEYEEADDPLETAKREFKEETGFQFREPFLALGTLRQPSGKLITAWAFEGDCDPKELVSNRFELEWPPKSGKMQSFPEIARAEWFDTIEARRRILRGQCPFIDKFEKLVLRASSSITQPI